jgi:hypothetical protein
MVVTRGAIEAVNGFDEVLDYGNDCHMQNIRDRIALLGGQVWLAPALILVCVCVCVCVCMCVCVCVL